MISSVDSYQTLTLAFLGGSLGLLGVWFMDGTDIPAQLSQQCQEVRG